MAGQIRIFLRTAGSPPNTSPACRRPTAGSAGAEGHPRRHHELWLRRPPEGRAAASRAAVRHRQGTGPQLCPPFLPGSEQSRGPSPRPTGARFGPALWLRASGARAHANSHGGRRSPLTGGLGAGERPTLYLYCLTARAPAGCRGKPGRWLHRYRSKLPWSKRCCRRTSLVPGSAAIPPRCAGGVRPAPAHRAATLLTGMPRSARAGVAPATGGALVRQGKRSPAPGQRGPRSRVASSGRKRLPGGRYRPG